MNVTRFSITSTKLISALYTFFVLAMLAQTVTSIPTMDIIIKAKFNEEIIATKLKIFKIVDKI